MIVVRVLIYEGEAEWLQQTLDRSIPADTPLTLPVGTIREVVRHAVEVSG